MRQTSARWFSQFNDRVPNLFVTSVVRIAIGIVIGLVIGVYIVSMTQESELILDALDQFSLENPGSIVRIQGHTRSADGRDMYFLSLDDKGYGYALGECKYTSEGRFCTTIIAITRKRTQGSSLPTVMPKETPFLEA